MIIDLFQVNGAIGGITLKGDIIINFFLEYPPSPESQVFEIENGNVGDEIFKKRLPKIGEDGPVRNFLAAFSRGHT
jgi:hypothetical protein